jgi:hypothetical protein
MDLVKMATQRPGGIRQRSNRLVANLVVLRHSILHRRSQSRQPNLSVIPPDRPWTAPHERQNQTTKYNRNDKTGEQGLTFMWLMIIACGLSLFILSNCRGMYHG